MTPAAARAFVKTHGIILESARGSVPSLAEAIAGAPIRGIWWRHPKARVIFRATRAVRDADDVLVCRLIDGRVTYVHRRLWPALVRIARAFPRDRLAAIREVHTANGEHRIVSVPFPRWVPLRAVTMAERMTEEEAWTVIGEWLMPGAERRRLPDGAVSR